jgi:hypothetical protein
MMSVGERQTVAGAYTKIGEHERECALRYVTLAETLRDMKLEAKEQRTLLWGILLSVLGFVAVTLIAIILKAVHLA